KKDLRWRIEHAQHIDPADIPRFGKLGVIASMQSVHATSDGPMVIPRLGEKRARRRVCLAEPDEERSARERRNRCSGGGSESHRELLRRSDAQDEKWPTVLSRAEEIADRRAAVVHSGERVRSV